MTLGITIVWMAKYRLPSKAWYTVVVPLASIIETGNHISHAAMYRLERAQTLAELIRKAADEQSPWAAFTEQSQLWTPANLRKLADEWPPLAQTKLAIGDATIKHVAEYYAQMGCAVRLLTGDKHLSSFEPPPPPLVPRRRKP